MRWDNLLVGQDEEDRMVVPLFPGEAVVRQFSTPQFRGLTFYEVTARSIVNHVPGDRFGFDWTINPYRGCTHACVYCLEGETPVLMAGGRTKALREVRVGDAVSGTVRRDGGRRLVATRVLAHWSTVRRAYRLTLGDGRRIVASGDHRFLSDRGWKHVTAGDDGGPPRPHLTVGEDLVGTSDLRPRVSGIDALGVEIPMFDITTVTGDFIANGLVSHNCFARPTHSYLDLGAGRDFETKIVVKVNAVDLLRRELRRPSWRGEHIAMGTNTDPYQRAEGHYRLMRGILSTLNASGNPYSVLTKGTLIRRDLDLLQEGASRTEVSAAFSIGTVDERVWRETEPGTPHPRKRLEVVRLLNAAGIPCGVLVAPVLPGLSDAPDQLKAVVDAAAEAGATHITPITLHLRPGVREEFLPWLERHHPDLTARYLALYRRSEAPREVREAIGSVVRDALRASRRRPAGSPAARHRGPAPAKAAAPAAVEGPPAPAREQLALDLGPERSRRAPAWVRGGLGG